MDAMFDLLFLIGALSMLYGVLGLVAGIAERSGSLRQWVLRALVRGS